MRVADGLHSFCFFLWTSQPVCGMMRINRVATCSSQRSTKRVRRGFGVGRSKPDGADAREAEQRGFGSNEANGAGI